MVLTRVGSTQLFLVGYLPWVKGSLLERGVLAQVATAAVASLRMPATKAMQCNTVSLTVFQESAVFLVRP
ncbi:hypothetical protein J2808_002683 [Pseudarthrobacter sulfonivorans]|nr:hypothetical protein [Pseudarthrobacter sulfonivorans]